MNIITENVQTTLEALSPKRLKKGLLRMLLITLGDTEEHGGDAEFTSEFFSELQILFDLLDELKRIKKHAKRKEE